MVTAFSLVAGGKVLIITMDFIFTPFTKVFCLYYSIKELDIKVAIIKICTAVSLLTASYDVPPSGMLFHI